MVETLIPPVECLLFQEGNRPANKTAIVRIGKNTVEEMASRLMPIGGEMPYPEPPRKIREDVVAYAATRLTPLTPLPPEPAPEENTQEQQPVWIG